MNSSQVTEIDSAYLAGVLDVGRVSVYVEHSNGRHRLSLKLFPPEHMREQLEAWVEASDFKPFVSSPWVWWRDEAVGRVMTMAWPHLRSEVRREQAQLVFRYFKTLKKPGLHLTADDLAEREAVRTELLRLRAG